eukprot:1193137-Prorocentrum_minimum.AAC.4
MFYRYRVLREAGCGGPGVVGAAVSQCALPAPQPAGQRGVPGVVVAHPDQAQRAAPGPRQPQRADAAHAVARAVLQDR